MDAWEKHPSLRRRNCLRDSWSGWVTGGIRVSGLVPDEPGFGSYGVLASVEVSERIRPHDPTGLRRSRVQSRARRWHDPRRPTQAVPTQNFAVVVPPRRWRRRQHRPRALAVPLSQCALALQCRLQSQLLQPRFEKLGDRTTILGLLGQLLELRVVDARHDSGGCQVNLGQAGARFGL